MCENLDSQQYILPKEERITTRLLLHIPYTMTNRNVADHNAGIAHATEAKFYFQLNNY